MRPAAAQQAVRLQLLVLLNWRVMKSK